MEVKSEGEGGMTSFYGLRSQSFPTGSKRLLSLGKIMYNSSCLGAYMYQANK